MRLIILPNHKVWALQATAAVYNDLGLPEYEGIEAFVQYRGFKDASDSPYYSAASLDEL